MPSTRMSTSPATTTTGTTVRHVRAGAIDVSTVANTEENSVAQPAHTYGQILKSSALIGGSSVINIAVSVVRAKAMAWLLGPAGVGLVGLYSSILDLTHSI